MLLACKANIVPSAELPPNTVVPYRVLPDKINPASGQSPSLPPEKLCRLVKLEPSVFTANTVPASFVPPSLVVPYRVLPDKINPACGLAPSALTLRTRAVKLYRLEKPVPSVWIAKIEPLPLVPPPLAVPYRVLPDNTNPAIGFAPSLPPVKLYRFVKPLPSVLMANTVT